MLNNVVYHYHLSNNNHVTHTHTHTHTDRVWHVHTNLRSSTQIQKLINNQYSFLHLNHSAGHSSGILTSRSSHSQWGRFGFSTTLFSSFVQHLHVGGARWYEIKICSGFSLNDLRKLATLLQAPPPPPPPPITMNPPSLLKDFSSQILCWLYNCKVPWMRL